MKLSKEEVEQVAALAKLSFNESEKEEFAKQLSDIMQYIEKLTETDVKGIKPTYHILPPTSELREDEVKPSLEVEAVLMNTAEQQDNFFKVPRVVE